MTLEQLAALCVATYGDSAYAFRAFVALADLKLADPDLFDGSRSVVQLVQLVAV